MAFCTGPQYQVSPPLGIVGDVVSVLAIARGSAPPDGSLFLDLIQQLRPGRYAVCPRYRDQQTFDGSELHFGNVNIPQAIVGGIT